jgi:hypothetical protein
MKASLAVDGKVGGVALVGEQLHEHFPEIAVVLHEKDSTGFVG